MTDTLEIHLLRNLAHKLQEYLAVADLPGTPQVRELVTALEEYKRLMLSAGRSHHVSTNGTQQA